MNILEILPALGKPRGTSTTDWQCWTPSAQYVDWGGEDNHLASVIVLPETGELLCIELYTGEQALRWIQPTLREEFFNECASRNIDPRLASEDLAYVELEDPEVILSLLTTLPQAQTYDPT